MCNIKLDVTKIHTPILFSPSFSLNQGPHGNFTPKQNPLVRARIPYFPNPKLVLWSSLLMRVHDS